MAAYAALVSVMQILDQLERHPSPPITLEKQQVESITQTVTFLQEFLEGYDSPFAYSDEADPLEMRIADAVYAAEDVIESYIVGTIQLRQHPFWSSFINCFRGHNDINNFCQDLQQVMEEMDSIKKEVMEMMKREEIEVQPHQPRQINIFHSSSLARNGKNSIFMVGLDDVLLQLLENLIGGPPSRQVIPITGMGGIGKTTLARNIFADGRIKDHFDICAWVTITQQYNTREIICQILSQLINGHNSGEKNEQELGEELHKYLFGRRYLIIMDDIWDIDVWEKMNFFLSDCDIIGSRIVVTTRLSYLTSHLTSSYALGMEFLDEVNSWNLFFKTVFGEKREFPLQLEEIGKKIVKHCRGLPLSIVVIGGLLTKSQRTQEHWVNIEQQLSSIVNSENDEYCLKILKLSYNHLAANLKPCFLYMGIFEEDARIRASSLIKLWVSEGFLKPEKDKSLETIGREFLKDLIDRNLIIIDELGSIGNMKYCKIHDLLRDLCLREGEKERFYHVIGKYNPQGIHNQRRVIYPPITSNENALDPFKMRYYPLRSSNERVNTPHVRSFTTQCLGVAGFPDFRLLRILDACNLYTEGLQRYRLKAMIHKMVNTRYLALHYAYWDSTLPSSVNLLWNLHTLQLVGDSIFPVQIWKMSQLRHVDFSSGVYLPDPPCRNTLILENLETLKTIKNFKCGDKLVNIIPNIKRLRIMYDKVPKIWRRDYCLRNLECLRKLESFTIIMHSVRVDGFMKSLTFPNNLKKLTLSPSGGDSLGLEKILEKIGSSSPHLQKLVLSYGRFTTGKWETVEGQFPNLKFLKLWSVRGLKEWIIEDSSHFPCLEKLHLVGLYHQLKEIPVEIGNMPTLQLIELKGCCESVVKSAKKIVEEQEELQGEQLSFHVRVQILGEEKKTLLSLPNPNFSVHYDTSHIDSIEWDETLSSRIPESFSENTSQVLRGWGVASPR